MGEKLNLSDSYVVVVDTAAALIRVGEEDAYLAVDHDLDGTTCSRPCSFVCIQ